MTVAQQVVSMYSMPSELVLKNPALCVGEPAATAGGTTCAAGTEPHGQQLPQPSLLFAPIKIRGVEFKNRVALSPMCQYSCVDGFLNTFHLAHYGQYAIRGCGAIVFEATGVLPNGRITPNCPGLWNDDQIAPMKAVNELCHMHGARTLLQLGHAGRKASCLSPFHGKGHDFLADESQSGWPNNVWGASPIKNGPAQATPQEMTREQIEEVVRAFGEAAARADKAGFDGVEIHGAHGYLIHSFYSPLSNKRTDDFGGSFVNRTRLALLIARSVRASLPAHKPLFFRISATDWHDDQPSWTIDDSIRLSALLAMEGVDLIDTSSSGIVVGTPKVPWMQPCFQAPLSHAIKKNHGDKILVGAVGNITTVQQADGILRAGMADMVFLGRVLLREPNWAVDAATELGLDPVWCSQYDWSKPMAVRGVKRN